MSSSRINDLQFNDLQVLIQVLKNIVSKGSFPHFHFCGPHSEDVLVFTNKVISEHYTNKSMVMQIHILDNVSESNLVQMITAFCNLQPVVADNDSKPKVIIIHQQNEHLTDNFVHFLEDRMTEKRVKFVFLTASMHVVPKVLINKMVSFTINPISLHKISKGVDQNDTFFKLINSPCDNNTLSDKIIQWSKLHSLSMPNLIYETWYNYIVNT